LFTCKINNFVIFILLLNKKNVFGIMVFIHSLKTFYVKVPKWKISLIRAFIFSWPGPKWATCIAITWRLSSSVNFWKKFFSSETTWPIETKREHNCPCHFKTCIWNLRTLHSFHHILAPIPGGYQMCPLYHLRTI
jgi:hypothetical protein